MEQYPVIVIPAFNPDETLINLLAQIKQYHSACAILVVNDGSKIECDAIFKALRAQDIIVLSHQSNRGKGEALKTAMHYFLSHYPNSPGIITADADGQHCVQDIIKLRQQLLSYPSHLHVGVREFSEKSTPLRSRFGNGLTRFLYKLVTRSKVNDTQCGLRGIPTRLIQAMVKSKASRYEFEFEMFFVARRLNMPILQTPIQTIYLNNNKGSHFNPLVDSLKIYYVFFRFCGVALLSFLVDFILFSILFHYHHHLVRAIVEARFVSAGFNFLLNKKITFKADNNSLAALAKYLAIGIIICFSSLKLTQLLIHSSLNVYASKIVAELFLFTASFLLQQHVVFFQRKSTTSLVVPER